MFSSMLFSLMHFRNRQPYYNVLSLFFSFLPGQKQQSVDQFLSRLPQSVIKDGKIIDVRSGVANVIKVCMTVWHDLEDSRFKFLLLLICLWRQILLPALLEVKNWLLQSRWLVNKVYESPILNNWYHCFI